MAPPQDAVILSLSATNSATHGGPWLWNRRTDLGVFVLPTLVALAIPLSLWGMGKPHQGPLPQWAWIIGVLGVDVAHVWATLYRTYLDPHELRKRPMLYLLLPLGCCLSGMAIYAHSAQLFWRVLAYFAVFHFIRQQTGWAAVYRARAGATSRLARWVDNSALYLATGVPMLIWHTRMPRPFAWFLDGDFIALPSLAPWVPWAQSLLVAAILLFLFYHIWLIGKGYTVPMGKVAMVLTTSVAWYVGIVIASDDLTFTLLNVLPHGVPYFALLWAYARARAHRAPGLPLSRWVALGIIPFLTLLLGLAFAEEMLWDRYIWHDREWLFGWFPEIDKPAWHVWLVPLLAVPQATHYGLDAVLWRRRDAGPEQATALGFLADSSSLCFQIEPKF